MALPVGLSAVTVAMGPYTDAGGYPYAGQVVFRPSTPVVWATTGAVILAGDVIVPLDATGAGTVVLPATNAAGLTATNFTYTVVWELTAPSGDTARVAPVAIQLPSTAPAVDLDVLAPMTATDGSPVSLPTVLSVAGLSGAVSASTLAAALNPYITGGGSSTTVVDGGTASSTYGGTTAIDGGHA